MTLSTFIFFTIDRSKAFHQYNIVCTILNASERIPFIEPRRFDQDFRVGGRMECVGNAVRFSRKVEVELSLGEKSSRFWVNRGPHTRNAWYYGNTQRVILCGLQSVAYIMKQESRNYKFGINSLEFGEIWLGYIPRG